MIYIYTEDSTSGFDFISTIIDRIIKPVVPWRIETLFGCKNCAKFLRNIDVNKYNTGDVLILYFDLSTIRQLDFISAVEVLSTKGVGYICRISIVLSQHFSLILHFEA